MAHKNKIPTAIPMLSRLTFLMAIIFRSPGVAITPEINMADKKVEVVLVWQVLLASQRCKTVVTCCRVRRRYRSYINAVRIYCKSICQGGNHKLEVLLVWHIMVIFISPQSAFVCRRCSILYGCSAFSPPS